MPKIYIYIIIHGENTSDDVAYNNIAAFNSFQNASNVLRKRKREQPYENQYDKIERLEVRG